MKDFNEFIELSNEAGFRKGIADGSHRYVLETEEKEGRELSDLEISYIYSHDLTMGLLALYHEWVNS